MQSAKFVNTHLYHSRQWFNILVYMRHVFNTFSRELSITLFVQVLAI